MFITPEEHLAKLKSLESRILLDIEKLNSTSEQNKQYQESVYGKKWHVIEEESLRHFNKELKKVQKELKAKWIKH